MLDELRRERAGSGRDYSGWNGHWQMRVQGHPINEVRMRVRLFKTMTDPAGDGRVAGPSECTEAFRQSQLAELRSEPAFLKADVVIPIRPCEHMPVHTMRCDIVITKSG